MVQSVAQFGFYGVSFLYCAVVLLNVGFIAACLVIEGQALTAAVPSVPVPAWIGFWRCPPSSSG